jgi:fucose 4-O-acetylase-like acetyltransferase
VKDSLRLHYIDIAKGIGIILVVVGHTSTPLYLHNIIYQFHMPLFFILSGLFLFYQVYFIKINTISFQYPLLKKK